MVLSDSPPYYMEVTPTQWDREGARNRKVGNTAAGLARYSSVHSTHMYKTLKINLDFIKKNCGIAQ